jgi:hypothetical protein
MLPFHAKKNYMARCGNCSRSLKMNKVIWDGGKLTSGEEICGKCWNTMVEMDFSLGQKIKKMTLEEVVYMLSSFKKSVYRKLFDAKLLSEENDRIVSGVQPQEGEHTNPGGGHKKPDDCAQCLKSLEGNKIFLGLGKLKTGEQVCEDCWLFLSRLDSSMSNRLKEFTLPEVKKIFSLVQSRSSRKEIEAMTEERPEPVVNDVSQTTNETEKVPQPLADVITKTLYAMPEPEPETKLPEVNTVTNRSEARLAAIGITRSSYPELWSVKELEELQNVLSVEEKILSALKGTYGLEAAVLVATNDRFILLSKKTFGGDVAEVYKLSWILSVDHLVIGTLSDVSFSLSSNVIRLTDVETKHAALFCDTLKPLLG